MVRPFGGLGSTSDIASLPIPARAIATTLQENRRHLNTKETEETKDDRKTQAEAEGSTRQ